MKPEEIFKRYDIRGRYPEELDEEFAELIGKALGSFTKRNYGGKIVVSRDNKESSGPLKEAFIRGARSTGLNVIDIGTGPTDFTAFTGRERNAVSVQVTSSHMPLDFNGFKFMYPEGNGFINEDLYKVKNIFWERDFEEGEGTIEKDPEAMKRYGEELVRFARKKGDDWDRKIVVDSLGGTAEILPRILERLGAEVIEIDREEHVNPPDPKPEKLDRLKEKVEEEDAEIGFASDLDADRLTVYRKGRGFLSGSEIFCVLAQLFEEPFVASIDTSKALQEFGEVHHTRVGDPFVMDKALEVDAELAGEPNGHYSMTDFIPYNSGMLTAAIIAGIDLDSHLEKIPHYSTDRISIEVEDNEEEMERIEGVVQERFTVESRIDGVKYSTHDSSILVRPSGSSPKIRIIGESRDREELEEVMQEAEDIVRNQ